MTNSLYKHTIGNFSAIEEQTIKTFCSFKFRPIDFHGTYWSRSGLVADFFAEFCSQTDKQKASTFKSSIATNVNEMIENSAKYGEPPTHYCEVSLTLYDNYYLTIEIQNDTSQKNVDNLRQLIHNIKSKPIKQVWKELRSSRKNKSASEKSTTSGIGIVLAIKDYDASFDFHVSQDHNLYHIHTKLLLNLNSETNLESPLLEPQS